MSRETAREVWVLNPKALAAFIENEPVCVRDEDLHLAKYHLSRYIRSPWAAEDGAFAKALMVERERRQANARTLT